MSAIVTFSPEVRAVTDMRSGLREEIHALVAMIDAGQLPPGFDEVEPQQFWHHSEADIVIGRHDHRPILLTSGLCASCGVSHLDAARTYTVMRGHELREQIAQEMRDVST